MKNLTISLLQKNYKDESESINSIANQLDNSFIKLCETVLNSKGKFVVMGVGKSGHIARKISATLSN